MGSSSQGLGGYNFIQITGFVHPSLELVALLARMREGSVVYTDYTRSIKKERTVFAFPRQPFIIK